MPAKTVTKQPEPTAPTAPSESIQMSLTNPQQQTQATGTFSTIKQVDDMPMEHFDTDTEKCIQAKMPKEDPYDWIYCSFLSCLVFPITGVCALYYAIRAQVAVDWKLNKQLIARTTLLAKKFTILSLIMAAIGFVVFVVVYNVVKDPENDNITTTTNPPTRRSLFN